MHAFTVRALRVSEGAVRGRFRVASPIFFLLRKNCSLVGCVDRVHLAFEYSCLSSASDLLAEAITALSRPQDQFCVFLFA